MPALPFSPLKLGRLPPMSPLVLAPLERVSCLAFRALCHRFGFGLSFVEMIRAKSITASLPVLAMLDTITTDVDPGDGVNGNVVVPTGIQLSVGTPDELSRCLDRIAEGAATNSPHWNNIIAVDLNFGCPKPEVVKVGLGPAMLNRPDEMADLFAALSTFRDTEALPSLGCVGAKIRLGVDDDAVRSKAYLPIADAANEHGLDFLTVHGRHAGSSVREQPVDYNAITEIVDRVKLNGDLERGAARLKVIGNGDVRCQDTLRRMMHTGVDGVMVGRAAIHNPWIARHLLDPNQPEWPNAGDLEKAELAAIKDEEAWALYNRAGGGIKNKYVTFRKVQFQRLNHFVATGEMLDVTRNEKVRREKREAREKKEGKEKKHTMKLALETSG